MYKLLLCWRYLRTRYIALASIISVTLGVATLIVVNSVMQGFTCEMQDRIHGVLSDVIIKAYSADGRPDFAWHLEQIHKAAGDDIEAVSPMVVVPAILYFDYNGHQFTRQVDLVGIDEETQGRVGDFGKFLQHPKNREAMSFNLRTGGYDIRSAPNMPERKQMRDAGWEHRREAANRRAFQEKYLQKGAQKDAAIAGAVVPAPATPSTPRTKAASPAPTSDPFQAHPLMKVEGQRFDPTKQQHTGMVLGIAMAGFRTHEGEDKFLVVPGDDVKIAIFTAAQPPKIVGDNFTVVDFYESKMSEYDMKFVFVPIRKLQEMRGMIDPTTGVGNINAIQIKVKPGVEGAAVRDKLRKAFPAELYTVSTWREEQGALLDAVDMETRILNVLLFMIIAVAGFGILAIFYMIVVEKTRDIGILKSLGASGNGVMGIFLGYGLSLGVVGAGAGMVIGLLFVRYINEIASGLAWLTRKPVFDPSIYYFYKIPAIVRPETVAWVVVGALCIAVAASILPARRAARLHPVEALRYE